MENTDKANLPTFDQLPSLVASLAVKLDTLMNWVGEKPVVVSEPMGIEACADYLTALEGRKVTRAAVYNRVHRGRLPYHKNGATLYFVKEDIASHLKGRKPADLIIEQIV